MVVWSSVAHLGMLGLVLFTPGGDEMSVPQVLSVDLVGPAAPPPPSAPVAPPKPAPQAAAPEPAQAIPPPPAEEPEPEPPKPAETVLPEKPRDAQPTEKPKPREREVFREPEKKQEKSLDDLLSEMRGAAGEEPAPPAEPVETSVVSPDPSASAGSGAGRPVSAELLAWVGQVKRHVRRSWVVPPGFRTQPLETHLVLTLDAAGNVLGEPRITKRSGNPWFDEGIVRGIVKASPLPAPPEAGDWDFVFLPGDSL